MDFLFVWYYLLQIMPTKLKRLLFILAVVTISPMGVFASFASSVNASSTPGLEMMNMHCAVENGCQDQRKNCLDHCLEMMSTREQTSVALQNTEINTAFVTDKIRTVFSYAGSLVPFLEHRPPIDPRLTRSTVRRE